MAEDAAAQETMEISPDESRPAAEGPADTFTGQVSVKPLFNPNAVRTFSSAEVTFTPCARTAWHTHPPVRP
jgi:quercetin dioxygenase-like cupin family protein